MNSLKFSKSVGFFDRKISKILIKRNKSWWFTSLTCLSLFDYKVLSEGSSPTYFRIDSVSFYKSKHLLTLPKLPYYKTEINISCSSVTYHMKNTSIPTNLCSSRYYWYSYKCRVVCQNLAYCGTDAIANKPQSVQNKYLCWTASFMELAQSTCSVSIDFQ